MQQEMSMFDKEMEVKLQEMRNEILSKMNRSNDDFKSVVGSFGKDSVDLASDDLASRKMEAISQVDANRLQAVEQALIRIRNGKYGICAQCGKHIPEERLRALPYALLCMECKSRTEKRR